MTTHDLLYTYTGPFTKDDIYFVIVLADGIIYVVNMEKEDKAIRSAFVFIQTCPIPVCTYSTLLVYIRTLLEHRIKVYFRSVVGILDIDKLYFNSFVKVKKIHTITVLYYYNYIIIIIIIIHLFASWG